MSVESLCGRKCVGAQAEIYWASVGLDDVEVVDDAEENGGWRAEEPWGVLLPQGKFTVSHARPPGAKTCSAYGMTFLAPPSFDLGKIEAAGRAGGWSPSAMNSAVGHYGSFDFQRSTIGGNTTFYSQYQVASNIAVGAYLNAAGIPEIIANGIEDVFAAFGSSNTGDGNQIMGQEIGWDAASGNVGISCGSN